MMIGVEYFTLGSGLMTAVASLVVTGFIRILKRLAINPPIMILSVIIVISPVSGAGIAKDKL